MFCPSLAWILVERNWKLRPASTRRVDSNAAEQFPLMDCPRRVGIFGWLATHSTDFISSKEPKWWNLFTVILPNFLMMLVNSNYCEFIWNYWLICLILQFLWKDFRNWSDTPTSSQRRFISTSREFLLSTQQTFRFHSNRQSWTMEMQWIWHRGYSWPREREFISSHSRDRLNFRIHHLHLF